VLAQKVGVSRFRQCTLHQGRLEQLFEELLEQSGRIKVERSVKTLQLRLDANALPSGKDAEYPVTLKVQHHGRANTPVPTTGILSPLAAVSSDYFSLPVQGVPKPSSLSRANEVETIHAKYLIGCDGAHSWTRRQLGVVMKGENSDVVWGVMDIVPLTDFRKACSLNVITEKRSLLR